MATRRNPDDALGGVLGIALFGLGGLIAFEWWRSRQQTAGPSGGESVNYPSGQAVGVVTSGASGITAPTSHPAGHGQIYV